VVDDAIDYGEISEKGNDLHLSTALGTEHGVHFIHFADHGRPALGRDGLQVFLDHAENQMVLHGLLHLPPVGIGVEPVITDHDLALIGDMGGDAGDDLQVVHRLLVAPILAVSVTDLALLLQERQPLQRKDRPDYVLPHPLSLRLGLRPHQAVDREACMPPGQKPLGPLRAEKLLADQKREHFPSEDLGQPRVVHPRDLMEDVRLVGPAFGHQEMEVRVKIDPVPEGLDGGDDARNEILACQSLEVDRDIFRRRP
jgi:hypothetical protein